MSVARGRPRRRRAPAWVQARPEAHGDPAGPETRMIETAIVILVGLILAVAVVYDVVRQVGVNTRQSADRNTWRAYTHQKRKNVSVRGLLRGDTDFVCQPAPLTAAAPTEQRLCLMVIGPVRARRRTVAGGYYLQGRREDRYVNRYACFGLPATRRLCGLGTAPPATPAPA